LLLVFRAGAINEVRLAHFCGIDGEADAKVVTITEINKFIGH
jgi:hypothetical protein